MKKTVLIILLIAGIGSAYAINFPIYTPRKSVTPNYDKQKVEAQPVAAYGGYSTVATGGTTTTGEGPAYASRPRRAPQPENPAANETYTDDGGITHKYINGEWCVQNGNGEWVGEDTNTVYEDTGNPYPVGEPWVMMVLAMVAGGVIDYRRRKAIA